MKRRKKKTVRFFCLCFLFVFYELLLKRFPLHDKERLEKWLRNMKRDAWTPSKHQLLCSDHFTPDSLDVRWGIRYLKHTAVPTIFSSAGDEVRCSCLLYCIKLTNYLCNTHVLIICNIFIFSFKNRIPVHQNILSMGLTQNEYVIP